MRFVAAKKSNIKEIVWNARGVILKRPTSSQAIDIRIKIAEYIANKAVLFMIYLLLGLIELLSGYHSLWLKTATPNIQCSTLGELEYCLMNIVY